MAVIAYYSTDASAPVLTGEVDKLCALLYACLVTGYGAKSGAGWTREFDGTNKSVFRPGSGNQFYLRVSDEGTGAANYARIVGYETMSDVDTGTNAFPTSAQLSGGLYCVKSVSANSTARPWVLIADDKIFHLIVDYNSDGATCIGISFGSFYSYKTSDTFNTLIIGNTTSSASTNYYSYSTYVSNAAALGHYMARRYDGLSTSCQFNKLLISGSIYSGSAISMYSGSSSFSLKYPCPLTGSLMISGYYVAENVVDNIIRGRIPGLWAIGHTLPFVHLDTVSGVVGTDMEGKTFLYLRHYNNGAILLETSDTWYGVNFQ